MDRTEGCLWWPWSSCGAGTAEAKAGRTNFLWEVQGVMGLSSQLLPKSVHCPPSPWPKSLRTPFQDAYPPAFPPAPLTACCSISCCSYLFFLLPLICFSPSSRPTHSWMLLARPVSSRNPHHSLMAPRWPDSLRTSLTSLCSPQDQHPQDAQSLLLLALPTLTTLAHKTLQWGQSLPAESPQGPTARFRVSQSLCCLCPLRGPEDSCFTSAVRQAGGTAGKVGPQRKRRNSSSSSVTLSTVPKTGL